MGDAALAGDGAAAVMLMVDEGRVGLEDPIGRWLPELAAPLSA